MANYLVTDTDLESVADAIREKGGTSGQLAFPAGFVSAIGNIPSGGGGRLLKSIEITMTTTITSSDKMTIDLEPVNDCIVYLAVNEVPQPDQTQYIALQYIFWNRDDISGETGTSILRPNGTIGTDRSMATYTKSTGQLVIGGDYGHYLSGLTYTILQFDLRMT